MRLLIIVVLFSQSTDEIKTSKWASLVYREALIAAEYSTLKSNCRSASGLPRGKNTNHVLNLFGGSHNTNTRLYHVVHIELNRFIRRTIAGSLVVDKRIGTSVLIRRGAIIDCSIILFTSHALVRHSGDK